MSARNGPGDDDRRLPEGERRIGERLAGLTQDTTTDRQNDSRRAEPINVWAHGTYVVGTRGRCRLMLVVARCPWCHRAHVHNGRPNFTVGKRQASCREGRYVVHLVTVEGQVAA
jgi:hypothetical protein